MAAVLTLNVLYHTIPHELCRCEVKEMCTAYRASFPHSLNNVTVCFSSSACNNKCFEHLQFRKRIELFLQRSVSWCLKCSPPLPGGYELNSVDVPVPRAPLAGDWWSQAALPPPSCACFPVRQHNIFHLNLGVFSLFFFLFCRRKREKIERNQ